MATPTKYTTKGYPIHSRSLDSLLGQDDRISSYQMLSSFQRPFVAAVLDGTTDPRYTYTITANDLAVAPGKEANFAIPFLHGLDYIPVVKGLVYIPSDTKRRPLPFIYNGPSGTSRIGSGIAATITIESVDDLYIYLRVTIYDIVGLSFLSSNSRLTFKFICEREQSA